MANNNWTDERMRRLDPPAEWTPDAAAALPKVWERDRVHRRHRAQWIGSMAAAAVVVIAFFATPAKCAFGVCRNPEVVKPPAIAAAVETPRPAAPQPAAKPAPAPGPQARSQRAPGRDFHESGSAHAPITVELFTDYECPHCATVYDQVIPMFLAEYVQTGKVKFIHRDLPLPQHPYAKLAARYANAAGHIGKYDVVVDRIFRTQPAWSRNGDIDSEVAAVLSPEEMERVRQMVRSDGHLEDSVDADILLARQDQLNQTPSMVVTCKGKTQVVAPIPPYPLLKSYLDELLTK